MAHDENRELTALMLYRDNVSMKRIAEAVGVTRQTIYNWKVNGKCTGGIHWDTWLKKQDLAVEAQRAEKEREQVENFASEMVPRLRNIIGDIVRELEERPPADVGDLEKLSGLLRRFENRGAELRQLQEEFAERVFHAIKELSKENQLREGAMDLIVSEMKKIQANQIKQVDGDYAAVLLSDTSASNE